MISSEVALLEVALKDALKLAAPLPAAERPAFIGRCLCAAHKGVEAPSASTDAAPDPTSLKEDLPELSKILSAAVNAACGREGWPLLAVGNQLLSTANGAASTAEASAVVAASPAAAALSPAAAPLPSRRHRNQRRRRLEEGTARWRRNRSKGLASLATLARARAEPQARAAGRRATLAAAVAIAAAD